MLQRYADYSPTPYDGRGLHADALDIRDWLVAPVIQTRDSDTLKQSNFRSCLREIGGESDDVQVHRFGHWGPGWYEIILIRPDTAAARTAEEIAEALADYPIVDEEDHSALEYETAADYWASASLRDRIAACVRFDVSIFAARREEIPEDSTGELTSYLADGR